MKALTPYEFGKLAFEKGIRCAPANDKEFLETHIKGLPVGGGTKLIKQWVKGWTEANLAQPWQ